MTRSIASVLDDLSRIIGDAVNRAGKQDEFHKLVQELPEDLSTRVMSVLLKAGARISPDTLMAIHRLVASAGAVGTTANALQRPSATTLSAPLSPEAEADIARVVASCNASARFTPEQRAIIAACGLTPAQVTAHVGTTRGAS